MQVDDSCEVGRACQFDTPEVDAADIEGLHYQPEDVLDVATSIPVGTRYFWRVRACETVTRCSEWTETRYLNVGRLHDDLNGDGYSDLFALSFDGESDYRLHLHPGPFVPADPPDSPVRPSLNIKGPAEVYGHARFLGDINGDGFADAIRGTASGAQLVLGAKDFQDIVAIELPGDFPGSHAVAGLGDWDGDGFADFAVAQTVTTGTPRSVVHLYSGNAEEDWTPTNISAPAGTSPASFGTALEGGIDFDGDGYTDLFILDGDEGRLHFAAGGLIARGKVKASLATGTPKTPS